MNGDSDEKPKSGLVPAPATCHQHAGKPSSVTPGGQCQDVRDQRWHGLGVEGERRAFNTKHALAE